MANVAPRILHLLLSLSLDLPVLLFPVCSVVDAFVSHGGIAIECRIPGTWYCCTGYLVPNIVLVYSAGRLTRNRRAGPSWISYLRSGCVPH